MPKAFMSSRFKIYEPLDTGDPMNMGGLLNTGVRTLANIARRPKLEIPGLRHTRRTARELMTNACCGD